MSDDQLEPVSAFLRERMREGRDLEPDDLARLTSDLAGRPELWRDLVRHSEVERIYVEIFRDHHLSAWLICWSGEQETGLHDHDVSAGAVQVVAGTLAEDRLRFGLGFDTTVYEVGERFQFDSSRIHDVRNADAGSSVSLHLYSPPLWRMGYYEVGEDGRISRRSASYADEIWAT